MESTHTESSANNQRNMDTPDWTGFSWIDGRLPGQQVFSKGGGLRKYGLLAF